MWPSLVEISQEMLKLLAVEVLPEEEEEEEEEEERNTKKTIPCRRKGQGKNVKK